MRKEIRCGYALTVAEEVGPMVVTAVGVIVRFAARVVRR